MAMKYNLTPNSQDKVAEALAVGFTHMIIVQTQVTDFPYYFGTKYYDIEDMIKSAKEKYRHAVNIEWVEILL